MTESIDLSSRSIATTSILRDFAKRAVEIQSELSQQFLEATRHCLEQTQRSSTEVWELFWKINTTPSVSERLEACQAWMKSVTERSAADASYLLEVARSIGEIELKALKRPSTDLSEDNQKAA